MREWSGKVAVFCENPGLLIEFTRVLNELGYYSLSLCKSVPELIELFEAGGAFEYLIFDGFELGTNSQHLETIAYRFAVTSIIVIADVNSIQRECVFRWASEHRISLGVLQAPLRLSELQLLIGRGNLARASASTAFATTVRL
ncbi:hypothetical protein [Pseudomonas chlororaphis]|uniref:Uncharacterized protein n=1 Tax=Pseudomonas chlororaphis subsp. aurantiaca TaxID=86192 RepID=A0AAJ0ZJZ0_9PSED|nr:hypothetical protein [Pseudomonas chlororaphis]MBU4634021.1 hypothetical protein [Pseudomonas chlororaphis subsp. aurantiaca]